MSSKAPPIPKGGGRSKKPIPANIQRAREQIAKERNRERANAMLEKARQNTINRGGLTRRQEQGVERAFQLRNEMDAMVLQEERRRARERVLAFQERRVAQDQVNRNIAESRRRGAEVRAIADIRGKVKQAIGSQELLGEITRQGVAGRKLEGIPQRQLANALFGGAGLQGTAREIFEEEKFKHTKVKPEPEPEPQSQVEGGIGGRPAGLPVEIGTINPANLVLEGQKGRPRGGDSGGSIHTKVKGITEPQPEPEPEFDPRRSRKIGE